MWKSWLLWMAAKAIHKLTFRSDRDPEARRKSRWASDLRSPCTGQPSEMPLHTGSRQLARNGLYPNARGKLCQQILCGNFGIQWTGLLPYSAEARRDAGLRASASFRPDALPLRLIVCLQRPQPMAVEDGAAIILLIA